MVRSSVFFRLGGFCDEFFAHMEEIDLCWRARLQGWKVNVVPRSRVFHLGGGSLPQDSPHKLYLNYRNNLLMLYKNLDRSELVSVLAVRFLLDLVAALQMLLTGQFQHALSVVRANVAFYSIRHEWKEERQRIQASRQAADIPERRSFSILWKYYARGKKKFSDL